SRLQDPRQHGCEAVAGRGPRPLPRHLPHAGRPLGPRLGAARRGMPLSRPLSPPLVGGVGVYGGHGHEAGDAFSPASREPTCAGSGSSYVSSVLPYTSRARNQKMPPGGGSCAYASEVPVTSLPRHSAVETEKSPPVLDSVAR